MIKQIQIYNVEFGDCFICQDDSSKMLVDFGSHHNKNISYGVIQNINNSLIQAENKYLMVTHFHNDHMNGIQNLSNRIIFSEVYLPNFFYPSLIKLQFASLMYLGKRSKVGKFALNLLSLIPSIASHLSNSSIIHFVKRGDRLVNNLDTCRVLWPYSDYLEEKASALYDELIGNFELVEDLEVQGKVRQIQEKIETFSRNYYDSISSNTDNRVLRYNTELSSLTEYVAICKDELFEHRDIIDYDLRKRISDIQNDICLCFDNNNEDKRVLFLSDITKAHYNKLSNLGNPNEIKLYENYNTIKVAHHGTKAYFVPNLPSSKNLIISNGLANNNPSWFITALYGAHYSNRDFYCTNYQTCDYSLTNKLCPARNNCAQRNISINRTLTL